MEQSKFCTTFLPEKWNASTGGSEFQSVITDFVTLDSITNANISSFYEHAVLDNVGILPERAYRYNMGSHKTRAV